LAFNSSHVGLSTPDPQPALQGNLIEEAGF